MTLAATILAWSGIALLVAIAPGPDMLLVAGHAARGGRRAGLLAAAGIVAGGIWYMALCGFGFLKILVALPLLFTVVKLGGALYLAYLGVQLIRSALKPKQDHSEARLLSVPFRQGLITNALNPKIALFYLAALPQFTGNGPDAPLIGVLLIAIHYAIGAACLTVVAYGASKASHVAQRSSVWRWLEGVLGTAFIGLAGRLAVQRS